MSASLVGSEMCIRDSRASSPASGASTHADICKPKHPRNMDADQSRAGTCLLYTSDAADDM
eukprot:14412190-Alexandrium_andersonii.AAC.1